MQLSFKTAWLKVAVEVEGVLVGILFTDTQQWHALPIFSALTAKERADIFKALGKQNILSSENVKWLTETEAP